MAIKKTYLLFLVLLGTAGLHFQCNKKFGCAETVYSFGMGIKAYPDKDSINIGDTIWLEINEPTTLKDAISGAMIDYSKASNLGSAIAFQSLSTSSGQFTVNAAQKFNLLIVQGTETANVDPTLIHEFLLAEVNNRYVFKIGAIPKETGIFRMIFSNASNVYRTSDKCTKAGFSINFKNTNQHYYLNPNFQGGPTPIGGDYYFKVK
jgi:hypothetical protein